MNISDSQAAEIRREIDELQNRVRELEGELGSLDGGHDWLPKGFYGDYHATTGFMLGVFGGVVSLLVNVIGAPLADKNPLEIIRIYLTFPMGEKALQLTQTAESVYAIDDGVILAIGCCLYLATGMFLGIPFQLFFARFASRGSLVARLVIATVLSLLIWVINFYCILSWLQPLLFGGNWIVDSSILPWWVAAVTHLVFGWTMAIVYPLGQIQHQRRPLEQ